MSTFFGVTLNYEMIPKYDTDKQIKTRWTKKEIIQLLKKNAKYLDESVKNNKHDSLIVIISCHGIQDHIVTSDYKKINKDTIHRIFSVDYPSLRNIPGIFMYDCCDGDNDMIRETRTESFDEPNDLQSELRKKSTKSIESDSRNVKNAYGTDKQIWYKGEANPDYKLVIINASNKGFASQMGTKSGSFMIRKFTEKMHENLERPRDRLFLYQIFHEIQDELHEGNKQLIEAKYNNKLEYIKFKRNNEERDEQFVELTNFKNDNNIPTDSTYLRVANLSDVDNTTER